MNYFYYQVIPLTRIPISKDPKFTYKFKEKIPFGSLVSIPFGKKTIKGIVLNSTSKPTFRTREIKKINTPALIDKNQLKLAQKISNYYFTSLGISLKLFKFNITKKTSSQEKDKIPQDLKIKLTKEQKLIIKKISQNPSGTKNLVFGPASSGKTEVAMSLIEKILKDQKQTLIIIPEIFLSYQEIYRYQRRFSKNKVALLHSKLKPSEISTIWRGVKSGEIEILIATKVGCFMPFKDLGLIVIDEEQDISHKNWDQNPKYHVNKTAKWLNEIHTSKLTFLSATPSIKNYWKAKSKKYNWRLLELPCLKTEKIKVVKPEIKILNLWENSYEKTGDIIFSKELLKDFKKTLTKNKVSLILVPYHGKSQAVLCENCKTALRCPKCQTSLIHTKDEYKCLHCSYKTSSLTSCPDCKSYKLKNIGFGTESVASELAKFFPKAKISMIERSNFEKNEFREKLFKKIKENKIDFLVGNQTIAKGFDFPNINLVAILNANRWTGKADYKFDERWLGSLFQVGGRLNRPGSDQKGIFYIQTFKSNLEILDNLKKWDWEKFAKKEIEIRKSLKYPPFCKLFCLTIKDTKKEKIEKTADKVYNQLEAHTFKKEIEVLKPYYGFVKKKGIFWNKHILIKTSHKVKTDEIKKDLKKFSTNWSVDPDPENIF